jgi:hypothetical protein
MKFSVKVYYLIIQRFVNSGEEEFAAIIKIETSDFIKANANLLDNDVKF